MNDKIKEMEEKNHEEFRKQMLQDMYQLLDRWKNHVDGLLRKKNNAIDRSTEELKQLRDDLQNQAGQLIKIKVQVRKELRSLKQERGWKFFLCCYLSALIGSLTGITLCGKYWPTIRWLLT